MRDFTGEPGVPHNPAQATAAGVATEDKTEQTVR
jgi:hypothetical protein